MTTVTLRQPMTEPKTSPNRGFCAIAADETPHQLSVLCSSAVSADRTQVNSINKHQLLYIHQQQFRADGTRNTATAQSPDSCVQFGTSLTWRNQYRCMN